MKYAFFLLPLILAGRCLAESDHDLAREAASDRDILPLATVIQDISDRFSATLLEVVLEREQGVYVYEFELITREGRMLEIRVDAATGEILREAED